MKFSELIPSFNPVKTSSLDTYPDLDPEISGVSPISAVQPNTISYIDGGSRSAEKLAGTSAVAVVLPLNVELQTLANEKGLAWVASPQPRLLFAQAIARFYQPFRPTPGIHPSAIIDPSAQLGTNVSIGAHVVIQAGVTIGNEVCIHPNVVIYPGVTVDDRTTLHANCVIHERSQIGADCVIHSGAAIGSEGFGFVPTADGFFKMQQSGFVVLEDGVEVGCNSAIDRPALGSTHIGRNTKIDNLVQIAHGCDIGDGCALAAQVGLAGAVKVGRRVILGGQVGVADHLTIGDGVQAGAQSGITADLEPGAVVFGTPAMPLKQFFKIAALWKQLPDMRQTLRRLQRQQ
ncbi:MULTISPECIES: UDP-3-O-(3-hydroxymyristoyl)glucosamine N-acyltransferase [unclassified Leptolyngbya]|uniref:UDP-3-O-(3-hydroxymyristoyl)glucosamine N-acyltransferase n=1 Tax=unclassified Leptolyngbya TaxID=2650499 RepID=UPI001687B695|nr:MULTISPECIES: UDP-3-O-(3-hydroxymyristoyl)glucosamine N-acyltransferase [unclassified Leptolyngbya]MBD1910124.1 UDP-3-O-(3-hydroxymyristoyl)glucosamine N-acyltransferase [Leptolyngbya sp. FACHB-8]MBD2156896.1 UDP-3-O-(3-hydroxymyristoyl)glucosamine N-acyltransferase [Leptolyngbya sp. FACHB-16]